VVRVAVEQLPVAFCAVQHSPVPRPKLASRVRPELVRVMGGKGKSVGFWDESFGEWVDVFGGVIIVCVMLFSQRSNCLLLLFGRRNK
jgi:hypothetical protein